MREAAIFAEQAEQERRDAAKLNDPVGTVRLYNGFADPAFLVRINDDERYPEDADPDYPSTSEWHVFHDYRTEDTKDHELDHSKLSEPIMVLTDEQRRSLGL